MSTLTEELAVVDNLQSKWNDPTWQRRYRPINLWLIWIKLNDNSVNEWTLLRFIGSPSLFSKKRNLAMTSGKSSRLSFKFSRGDSSATCSLWRPPVQLATMTRAISNWLPSFFDSVWPWKWKTHFFLPLNYPRDVHALHTHTHRLAAMNIFIFLL